MVALVALFGAACGDSDDDSSVPEAVDSPTSSPSASLPSQDLDGVVAIEGGRGGLYVRCTGEGSPTVILEGGDGDDSGSYFFAEEDLGAVTRTCVYDRANLGQSDPAGGPRGLDDLVGELEQLLQSAEIPGPYVLVGTSGGGYITAGYAVTNKDEVAGLAFFDTLLPSRILLERSSMRRPGTTRRTSNSVNICRLRRTRGLLVTRSATSLSRSSASSIRLPRSRNHRSRRSGRRCAGMSRIKKVGWCSARAPNRWW